MQFQRLSLQSSIHVVRRGHASAKQAFTQAVALKGIEHERFFVGKRRFSDFEINLQALAEKVLYRVSQEIL